MNQSDEDLDQLDALLQALPVENMPMTVSELDGYIVGVLACPEMIPPSAWLPLVWGDTGSAEFPDEKAAEETVNAVMTHYNSAVASLAGSLWVEPIYEIDPNSDEIMWEPWVDGFTCAMRLRPDAWSQLFDQVDEETQTAMIFLMVLQDIYTGQSNLTDKEIDKIDVEAPDLIPNCVATILQQSRPELSHRNATMGSGAPFKAGSRPGRNDPCACGSGRKYKKCCGLH